MKIDINALSPADQYKLLSATIVPRPIALITTLSEDGVVNAAPFSFFNVMGEDPPVLAIGLQHHPKGSLKDTTVNIQRDGQFVVHMVDEALAEPMGVCGIRFPPGEDETKAAGLSVVRSDKVLPPRIAEAPVAFECEKIAIVQVGPGRNIALGKVVMMHARPGLIDPEKLYIDTRAYHPVGRLFGVLYTRTRDHFELPRPSYDEWLAGHAITMRDVG